jgi:hypothetical protein
MSREASRARARNIAASLAQLHGSLADPALMGYPLAVLCKPLQRPALPCASAGESGGPEATAPAVEARRGSTYKE